MIEKSPLKWRAFALGGVGWAERSGGFVEAALGFVANVFEGVAVSVDGDDGEGIGCDDKDNVVQLFESRLDIAVAVDLSLADEIEPDACAMFQDAILAHKLEVAVADVALRAAMLAV
jgi:hypothetical protein